MNNKIIDLLKEIKHCSADQPYNAMDRVRSAVTKLEVELGKPDTTAIKIVKVECKKCNGSGKKLFAGDPNHQCWYCDGEGEVKVLEKPITTLAEINLLLKSGCRLYVEPGLDRKGLQAVFNGKRNWIELEIPDSAIIDPELYNE